MWRKRSELTKFANGKFMTDEDRCPAPIITDLEGDGVNEIVLISNDLQHLNILAMPIANEDDDKTLAHVEVKSKTELSLKERVTGHISKPYVVGVGFTVPYLSMIQIRKQVKNLKCFTKTFLVGLPNGYGRLVYYLLRYDLGYLLLLIIIIHFSKLIFTYSRH